VEHAGLIERAGRAGLDTECARAAVQPERRRRLELDVGHERAQHDPGAKATRDQHRVLAVKADSGANGRLAIDMLVRVHEDAVLAAKAAAEFVEALPQRGVRIPPRVARQPPVARWWRLAVGPVAEGRGHDRAGTV